MALNNTLKANHLFLVLFTVFIWGMNFIAIYFGLKGFSPFLLSTLRFALASLPWVFFLPRPKAPLKYILGYGIFTFAFQFGFLFSGIYLGLSPGLSSLVLQVQVFFSMALAAMFFNDKPNLWKIIGSLISFIGIGIVAMNVNAGTSFVGLIVTLLAAFSWAAGNMFSKKVDAQSPLALVVWGNLVALPFMVVMTLAIDGPTVIWSSMQHVSILTIVAVAYIVYVSTHVGYGAWGMLLNSYPTATIVPFTLLIPIVGFLGSALFLGEDLSSWKLVASFFVMAGLAFNLLEKQIRTLTNKLLYNKGISK